MDEFEFEDDFEDGFGLTGDESIDYAIIEEEEEAIGKKADPLGCSSVLIIILCLGFAIALLI